MPALWEASDVYFDGAKDGDIVSINASARRFDYKNPGALPIHPDNAEAEATVDLSDSDKYPPGSLVFVEDIYGAETNEITVTPKGNFVDSVGDAAVVAMDVDNAYYLFLVTSTNTVVLASGPAAA